MQVLLLIDCMNKHVQYHKMLSVLFDQGLADVYAKVNCCGVNSV